jgi:sigma-B regulation protein RsbU (phosphoserine phosphatase)
VSLISTAPSGPFSKITVLVVDDSRAQRFFVAGNLKKWGFSVREAATGLQALEICEAQRIDMVLCDWMMPEMDGLEFCEAFRALQREYYGYFILLTSKSDKNDVAEGLDKGADDFLSKPVNPVELRARLNAGLRLLDMESQLIRQNAKTEKALGELQQLYQTLDRDLVEAGKLQQSLIPIPDRLLPNGRVSVRLQSAGHVGGDLAGYFVFDRRIGPRRVLGLAVGAIGRLYEWP